MQVKANSKLRITAACVLCFLAPSCNTVTVRESVLSTNQRVATVSNPGDGITPPTSLVLFEERPGRYVPVAAGFAQAPATAFLEGAAAGIAIGIGTHGVKSKVTVQGTSAAQSTGGSATGGTGTGGSVTVP